ncbi:hypothetical protein V8J82_23290, partial [Gymnodinialimonas sp. 2305UL16-5]
SKNVVVRDLELGNGAGGLGGSNIIFDGLVSTEDSVSFQNVDGLTVRDSSIYDIAFDAPPRGASQWETEPKQGSYFHNVDHLLLEGNFYDHNGWTEGYDPDGSADSGMTPNVFSHNVYIQHTVTDITVRDNIIMRGSSFGAQVRPGGFIEDNVFADNNAAVNFLGAHKANDEQQNGHFTLFTDNLITSGGSKTVGESGSIGTLTRGVDAYGWDSILHDNIVAHLADPDNPEEQASKLSPGGALRVTSRTDYDDTIVYNWVASNDNPSANNFDSPNRNIAGLDTETLDQTTLQRFAAELLGKPTATIDDLAQFLRAQGDVDPDNPLTADDIIAYFQNGFGIAEDVRTEAATLRFVPNDLGDGIRWDNRLNWDTEDLPGTIDGDSVDLAGNWVNFGGTTQVDDLDFGSGGRLSVNSGRLDVTGDIDLGANGGEVDIDRVGQFWIDGFSDTDTFDIDVNSGRFANTGDVTGQIDLHVTGGQAILATGGAEFEVNDGSRILVDGSDARVGFDGDDGDTAILDIGDNGGLAFIADENGLGVISEFRSGAHGDAPNVLSGIDLGDGTLALDISALAGSAFEQTFLEADEIVGMFDRIEISGLQDDQDVTLTFDYDADTVMLSLTAAGQGNGVANIATAGDMMNAQNSGAALWDALTDGQGTYSDTEPPVIEPEADGNSDLLLV